VKYPTIIAVIVILGSCKLIRNHWSASIGTVGTRILRNSRSLQVAHVRYSKLVIATGCHKSFPTDYTHRLLVFYLLYVNIFLLFSTLVVGRRELVQIIDPGRLATRARPESFSADRTSYWVSLPSRPLLSSLRVAILIWVSIYICIGGALVACPLITSEWTFLRNNSMIPFPILCGENVQFWYVLHILPGLWFAALKSSDRIESGNDFLLLPGAV
jgi:hypothetical protein